MSTCSSKFRHTSRSATSSAGQKGRSSRKIQQEFEHIRKRYWGQRFWQRGYFSTTSGNITDDVIENYLNQHTNMNGFSPSA
ncbi:transposase [Novosphingobium colocasiae]